MNAYPINQIGNLKTGKRRARFSPNLIKFKTILRPIAQLPPLPDEWLWHMEHPEFAIRPQMLGNDTEGCCVEKTSYETQQKFEAFEQGIVVPITAKMVVDTYENEAGGNYGLVMIDHLGVWKNVGIPFGSIIKKKWCYEKKIPVNYKIHSYSGIDWTDQEQVKYAIMLLACNIGVEMPDSFADQFNAKVPWDDIDSPSNPQNGHCMGPPGWTKGGKVLEWLIDNNYIPSTTPKGEYLILDTWEQFQPATWPWVRRHTDECYAIVDDKDSASSTIDPEMLEVLLAEVKKRKIR